MGWTDLITGTATTAASTNAYTDSLAGSTIYYPQQLAIQNYQQYAQQSQLANAFGNMGAIIGLGQGIGTAVEKVKEKAKGFLAELREEIDAWHGDCLRV